MSDAKSVPKGWSLTTIGEVTLHKRSCNPAEGSSPEFKYVDIEALDNDRQIIVSPKILPRSEAPSRARMAIQCGDVIFSLVRPYLKNVAVVPPDLDGQVASTAFCVLRPASGLESKFVFYQLVQDSFIRSIPTYGTSPPAARDDEFLRLPCTLAPAREQRRIVSKIEELFSDLDAGVAALERAKANLTRYRAAVLKAAVEGKLTAEWRKKHSDVEPASKLLERILAERRKKWEDAELARFAAAKKTPPKDWKNKYEEPAGPDVTGLPELPKGWCWTTITQIMGKVVDGTHFTPTYVERGVPFLSVKDIREEVIHFDDCKYISSEEHARLKDRCNPQCGDVVITKSGTIGRTAVVKTDIEFSLFVSVALLKPASKVFLPEWASLSLQAWLKTINVQNDVKGSTIKNLHLEDIRPLRIPLPPRQEQEIIVRMAEECFAMIQNSRTDLELLLLRGKRLRQSILRRAFEGKLVPQDPRDEPAGLLLDRVKAEREAAQPPKLRLPARKRTAKDTV